MSSKYKYVDHPPPKKHSKADHRPFSAFPSRPEVSIMSAEKIQPVHLDASSEEDGYGKNHIDLNNNVSAK